MSPMGEILVIPLISRFPHCFACRAKKAKRGKKHGGICAVPKQENWRKKMKPKKTKRKQQGCDVEKAIDTFKKAADAAVKVYKSVEPIVKTIVAHRRKTR